MPSFFSSLKRRKSEANLPRPRAEPAPALPQPPPLLPPTARLSVFGLDSVVGTGPASPARSSPEVAAQPMQRRRSRSATRVLEQARPQREEAQTGRSGQMPPLQPYPAAASETTRLESSSPSRHKNGTVASPPHRAEPHTPQPVPPRSNGSAGLPPSSSFWEVSGAASPPWQTSALGASTRRESPQAQAPRGFQEVPSAGLRMREMSVDTNSSESSIGRLPERRESLQARQQLGGFGVHDGLTAPISLATYSPGSSSAFAARPSLPPGAAPPQPGGSPIPDSSSSRLAAFYGTPFASATARSATSLAETNTTGSPVTLFTRQLSSGSGGDGSATTPGVSDSEQSEDIESRARAKEPVTVLDSPVQVTPRRLAPAATPEDVTVSPRRASASASNEPARPTPQAVHSESSQSTLRSPMSSYGAGLVPPAGRSVEQTRPPPPETPRKLVKRRSSTFAPVPAPSTTPVSRPPIPPALSPHPSPSKSRAARPITPPTSPERARRAAGGTGEVGATLPPRRSSLVQSGPPSNTTGSSRQPIVPLSLQPAVRDASTSPSRQWQASPTTPRRLVPEPVSPTKRGRVAGELTPRAAALAAARDREKRMALEEAAARAPVPPAASAPLSPPESDRSSPVELVDESADRPRPRVEYAFAVYPEPILRSLLRHLSHADTVSLRLVSRTLRRAVEVDGKELMLERFLGSQGYRRFARRATTSGKAGGYLPSENDITLDLRDLSAFRAALRVSPDEYAHLARAYTHDPARFSPASLRLARATTRAWNRVVLRLRLQSVLPSSAFAPPAFPELAQSSAALVYKPGRAASLRVWVPTRSGESWMADGEVIECEREVWRSSGAWAQLRRGDVVANVAIPAFGNVGTLVFDGKFLRDLSFEFDVVGHLPAWLNMLGFSPSHFHNIVVASSSNPVFYLSLAPYVAAVCESLSLCKDRVSVSSPQGNYLVSRYVYRAALHLLAGQIIGDAAGAGGAGPGGIEVVHPDWAGQIVVEAEGTTEAATLLLARVASVEPTPWRILREKSRPGKIWLKPVLNQDSA